VRKSFQFKLFGCKRLRHLQCTIDVAAEIWNYAIALHRRYYRLLKKTLPKARLQAHLAKLRVRNGKMSHWQLVRSQSVQAITDRLYLAWEAFFRGDIKRPPTFRKRRKYRSFTLKQCGYKSSWTWAHQDSWPEPSVQPKPPSDGNNQDRDRAEGRSARHSHNIFV
jgi:putative transposase